MSSSTDCRGVERGQCSQCSCNQYNGGQQGKKCMDCGHPPGKHVNMNTAIASLASPSLPLLSTDADSDIDGEVSGYLGKHSFDPNTGLDYTYDADDESTSPPCLDVSLDPSKSDFSGYFSPTKAAVPQYMFQSPPQQSSISLDQQCKLSGCTRKKFTEQLSGYVHVHDFCGKTHAKKYEEDNCQVSSELRCKTLGCFKQRHIKDQGGYFDYCSNYCRHNGCKPYEPVHVSASAPNITLTSDGMCIFPGCKRAKYCDPANNRTHDFCGRSHAYQARMQGITGTTLIIRVATRQEFSGITAKFQQKWAKGSCPPVSFVYIITNRQLTERFTTYKNTLQKKEVEEYYHGTKLTCNITVNSALCNDKTCGVCGITNTGLDRRCIRENIQFQRFGHGFYLAPNSSKCHDYTQGSHSFRAMLAFDVCPGNKYELTSDNEKLKGPPQGFDSVYGKVGVRLNYEELVVYNPDATLPKYIVVYKKDDVQKIAK